MRILETKAQKQYREQYLNSDHWKDLRERKLKQRRSCQKCGTNRRLHIHHLTYERRGHEELTDLIVLCRICHLELHRGIIKLEDISDRPKKKKSQDTNIPLGRIYSNYKKAMRSRDFTKTYNLIKNIDISHYVTQEQYQLKIIIPKITSAYRKQNNSTKP